MVLCPIVCHHPVMCFPAPTTALYVLLLLPFMLASPACISPPYHVSRAPSNTSRPPPPCVVEDRQVGTDTYSVELGAQDAVEDGQVATEVYYKN